MNHLLPLLYPKQEDDLFLISPPRSVEEDQIEAALERFNRALSSQAQQRLYLKSARKEETGEPLLPKFSLLSLERSLSALFKRMVNCAAKTEESCPLIDSKDMIAEFRKLVVDRMSYQKREECPFLFDQIETKLLGFFEQQPCQQVIEFTDGIWKESIELLIDLLQEYLQRKELYPKQNKRHYRFFEKPTSALSGELMPFLCKIALTVISQRDLREQKELHIFLKKLLLKRLKAERHFIYRHDNEYTYQNELYNRSYFLYKIYRENLIYFSPEDDLQIEAEDFKMIYFLEWDICALFEDCSRKIFSLPHLTRALTLALTCWYQATDVHLEHLTLFLLEKGADPRAPIEGRSAIDVLETTLARASDPEYGGFIKWESRPLNTEFAHRTLDWIKARGL
ncbi:MAG: hypothetical protein K0S07_1290 [Chlamydiales bacterium]|jgi:hypothetical protein|nr:hypothetical protein [Chlamydiales bacterium]